ncbi:hypothetical protein FH972_017205 [Carpinus fangiana]|uniref:Rx N-terminal domain-containing protein n=1 Tax=Carpinus fangiana TaxID=176857 RepID=A0A5N6RKA8_9ROSI|nr:hypothetical protein FH972_017205 [Carpinus fangiana]
MTETVVTLVINELVRLIVHESKLLSSVHREVVDIRDELESIQCFLKDADKGDLQDGVKTWMKQVREVAYHIEDVIDEYVLQVAQYRHQQSFIAFLNKIGRLLKILKPHHNIATKIQDIKISVREIKERSERYGFSSPKQGSSCCATNATWHDPRVGSLFTKEDEVVGMESTRDELVHKLQPLSQDKAWELFCRKAFHTEFQGRCPRELVKMSMEIVRKCEGLPLAIVAIGGLLSTKEKVPSEWKRSFIVKLFRKFKLLKVLDFEDAPIDYLPQEVGNLFHLKYLSLRRTKVKILPKSVGRLHNLQTLNVVETAVRELPIEIFRLYKLRHILAHFRDFEIKSCFYSLQGVKVHEGIGSLKNLQVVTFIEANHHGASLFKELGKLSQLRVLGISNLTAELCRALCTSIQNMVHLDILVLGSINEYEIIDLESISSPPPFLAHIYLRGRLEKLPNWIPDLQNLVTLVLSFTSLEEDPLFGVQALPNLVTLSLNHAYDGEQLHFVEGGFRKLKNLTLRGLKRLKIVEIDNGSLPVLQELAIGPCPQMGEVPSGFQHLKSLKILDFYEMHREFVLRMQHEGGQDYWKVKKVTTIRLKYRIRGERYQTYKLNDSNLLKRLQG